MSFSFYVRLIRKHDGTAKRNQMRQFACQDIVDLETYDLRTCGVASAEIMFKIKSCSNPITYMRNAFDILHGVLMKKKKLIHTARGVKEIGPRLGVSGFA